MDGTYAVLLSESSPSRAKSPRRHGLDLLGGDEDAERDGQVEGRSFFSAICRGEDDGDSAARPG
jgi:hypothetical protein